MASGSTAQVMSGNKLIKEKSPYLLQHAANPVDWYPWGQEAFDKAKSENKPIFLSIGYSTCHWCHVMERESFENEEIAKLLNESYVSVKVDREERPDVDKVYMTYIQATQGGGGWPLSVFLTPDLKPFLGGTYFPPRDSPARPGFATILEKIAAKWKDNHQEAVLQGNKIMDILSKSLHGSEGEESSALPGTGCIQRAYESLEKRFDKDLGGFGNAPKFPQPTILNFLLRVYSRYPDSAMGEGALQMTLFTLKAMANGGMHDHVGQGFHRYSTDKFWHVPHFEKMLYDQGQLASIYAAAFQITKDVFFKDVLEDILLYVSKDLLDKDGGFYSAEDADSFATADEKEKREGAFCVWSHQEITSLLTQQILPASDRTETLSDLFCQHYGVEKKGNVKPHQDPHGELKGQNVLIVRGSVADTARAFELEEARTGELLEQCRKQLLERRQQRPKPHRDDKILTAWNGLMISGFSQAFIVLGDKAYLEKAKKAAEFVKQHLYNTEGGVLTRNAYREADGILGVGTVRGFADDYSFLIGGLLDLFEASQEEEWLEWACQLQQKMTELFWDKSRGGFYSATDADPTILLRIKEDQDGAEPSPNSFSAHNLRRLSTYLPSKLTEPTSADIFKAFREMMNEYPVAIPEMLSAFILHLKLPKQIIIVGESDASDTKDLLDVVNSFYLPNKAIIIHEPGSKSFLTQHLQVLDAVTKVDGKATAYVCENYTCASPINDPGKLKKELNPRKMY